MNSKSLNFEVISPERDLLRSTQYSYRISISILIDAFKIFLLRPKIYILMVTVHIYSLKLRCMMCYWRSSSIVVFVLLLISDFVFNSLTSQIVYVTWATFLFSTCLMGYRMLTLFNGVKILLLCFAFNVEQDDTFVTFWLYVTRIFALFQNTNQFYQDTLLLLYTFLLRDNGKNLNFPVKLLINEFYLNDRSKSWIKFFFCILFLNETSNYQGIWLHQLKS